MSGTKVESPFTRKLWCLGFGFYWTWVYLSFNSAQITSQSINGIAFIPILHIVSGLVGCVAFALVVVFHQRIEQSKHLGMILWMMAALTAFGSMFYALPLIDASTAVIMGGAVITGFASVWLALAWGARYCTLDVREATLLTAGSFLLAGLLYLLIANMSQPFSGFVVTFLPILSALCLYLADPEHLIPLSKQDPSTDEPLLKGLGTELRSLFSRAFSAKVIIGIFMAMFVCGGLRIWSSSFGESVYNEPLLVGLPTAVVATVFLAFGFLLLRNSTLNLGPLYRIALPLLAIASVMLAMFGTTNAWWAYLIVQAGASLMDMLTWLLLIEIARTTHFSPLLIFAVGRMVIHAGMALGELLALTFIGSMSYFLMACVAILVVVAGFMFTDRDMTFYVEPPTNQELNDCLERPDALDERIRAIAAEKGLSPRETEVFMLWATGYGMKGIQEKLTLSPATVKTHLRHIYEKCDVHSRADILELIEAGE